MSGYKRIINNSGDKVSFTTIRGLRTAVKKHKLNDGRYIATFRNGTTQTFEIFSISVGKDKKTVTRVKARHTQTNKIGALS